MNGALKSKQLGQPSASIYFNTKSGAGQGIKRKRKRADKLLANKKYLKAKARNGLGQPKNGAYYYANL